MQLHVCLLKRLEHLKVYYNALGVEIDIREGSVFIP